MEMKEVYKVDGGKESAKRRELSKKEREYVMEERINKKKHGMHFH